jgi:hypothetical protein
MMRAALGAPARTPKAHISTDVCDGRGITASVTTRKISSEQFDFFYLKKTPRTFTTHMWKYFRVPGLKLVKIIQLNFWVRSM